MPSKWVDARVRSFLPVLLYLTRQIVESHEAQHLAAQSSTSCPNSSSEITHLSHLLSSHLRSTLYIYSCSLTIERRASHTNNIRAKASSSAQVDCMKVESTHRSHRSHPHRPTNVSYHEFTNQALPHRPANISPHFMLHVLLLSQFIRLCQHVLGLHAIANLHSLVA
jgi:hypothetical protein